MKIEIYNKIKEHIMYIMAYLNYTVGFVAYEGQKLKDRLISDVEIEKNIEFKCLTTFIYDIIYFIPYV